ncbi:hypothetical protein EDC53_106361 [Phytobacter diazotrophicus]|nr:hypothetical protein EDC53_106361 [Phytobacter diazotrophicus]
MADSSSRMTTTATSLCPPGAERAASNSSQTDRRQRGGRRTQCEARISLRGRRDCKGERGVPLYPFTCPKVTFRHEHKVNGTRLLSRIFPLTLTLSPKRRGDCSCSHFCGDSSAPGEREKTGGCPDKAVVPHPGQHQSERRPSGTTSGVPAIGSSIIIQRKPYTASISSAVTISFGAPCATILPSRRAIKWVA